MPLYEAYGLKLSSALPLPELLPGEGEADVFVDIRDLACGASTESSSIRCASASPRHVHLTWGAVGDLQIENGLRITLTPVAGADEAALRLFVLGAGLGVLLHQRDLLVFHASGVVMGKGALGFFGGKGWGKSTMAAALNQLGNPLISDELLAIQFDPDERPWVLPGSPQIRLWSDSLAHSGGSADTAVRVRSGIDKFSVGAANSASEPHRLLCAYLLAAGQDASIQPVPPSQAFLWLVPHLYVSRFGTDFLAATGASGSFRRLNAFVRKTPVKRLMRRRDLSELPEVVRMIERDIAWEAAVKP